MAERRDFSGERLKGCRHDFTLLQGECDCAPRPGSVWFISPLRSRLSEQNIRRIWRGLPVVEEISAARKRRSASTEGAQDD